MTDVADIESTESRGIQGKARDDDDEILLLLALLTLADVENAIVYWQRLAPQRLKGLPLARLPRTGLPVEAVATSSVPAWNPATLRYVQRLGDEIPTEDVRAGVLAVIAKSQAETRRDTLAMLIGAISLIEWQERMYATIKSLHLALAIVGVGGRLNMPLSELARSDEAIPDTPAQAITLADLIAYQFGRARRFAKQIEERDESAETEQKIENRVALYGESAYPTYIAGRSIAATIAGFTQELNVLNPAEHCRSEPDDILEDCPSQTEKGWVDIGELVEIGGRKCLMMCKCTMRYRDPVTGRESA